MKANELRIGSYVQISDKIIIMDTRIFHAVIHGFPGYEPEPILLTEEWLVKFGFVKKCNSGRSDDLIYWDRIDISLFINYDGSINLGCELSEYEDCVPFNENEIKYVHQLQNLYFALTGEELTIKINQ